MHDCWLGEKGIHDRLEKFLDGYIAAIDAHLIADNRSYRCREIQAITTNRDAVYGCWLSTEESHHWFNVSCDGLLYGSCGASRCPAKFFSENS